METKKEEEPEEQDFSSMKLSELIKFDYETEEDIQEYNLLIQIYDKIFESPQYYNTNLYTNHELENGAEEASAQPTIMIQDFINQMLVDLMSADDENKIQKLKTAFESEEDKTGENENLLVNNHANGCITGKRKPKSIQLSTEEYQPKLRAKRAKRAISLPAVHVASENLETPKADLQNQPLPTKSNTL